MKNALAYAKKEVNLSKDAETIIMHSRKTLIFKDEIPWVKNNGDPLFDVPMGAMDGAEIAELVGLYLHNEMKGFINKEDGGLYMDDFIAVLRGSKQTIERTRKELVKLFADNGLKLEMAVPSQIR